jgi:hypothetical protein
MSTILHLGAYYENGWNTGSDSELNVNGYQPPPSNIKAIKIVAPS